MAVSDISLTAGMRSNLRALQSTALLMDRTQERLSTGKRVNSPMDDPVNFFTAQAHMQRAADLSLRKDGMSEAIQTVQAADAAYTSISSMLNQAKGLAQQAVVAATPADFQPQFDTLMEQISIVANNAGYKGINLLADPAQTLTVEFAQTTGSFLDIVGTDASSATLMGAAAAGDWAATGAWATVANVNTDIGLLDTAIATVRTVTSALGTNLAIIQTRQDFATEMIDTLKVGADKLTLADMNEESANMLMLETRQQLGVAALGMSTDYAQSILRLFQ